MRLLLRQIPLWTDNYAYLLCRGDRAVLVDAPEADPVRSVLEAEGLTLVAILNTHHHPDHIGANTALAAATGCDIYGPAHDAARIPGITQPVAVGATVSLLGVSLRVEDVAAHTRGHICFVLDTPLDEVWRHGHEGVAARVPRLEGRGTLFCGDSLFLGGCGRLFEGDAAMLHRSLRFYHQADPTYLVCCAHEYTASNLRFAAAMLPENDAIAARLANLDEERTPTGSSVPDVLARERQTNPFLLAFDDDARGRMNHVLERADDNAAATLFALRQRKDSF